MTRSSWMAMVVLALCPLVLLGADDDGFVPLFDGKTLEGWTQRNGLATYRVEEGTVVGRTAKNSPNSFLCTNKAYCDFELLFEVKVDEGLNSGVQIRSRSSKDYNDERVHGPQVEIERRPESPATFTAKQRVGAGSARTRTSKTLTRTTNGTSFACWPSVPAFRCGSTGGRSRT